MATATGTYRVTQRKMSGSGATLFQWKPLAEGFKSLTGAATWMYDTLDTDHLAAPVKIEKHVRGEWRECLTALPEREGWERHEVAITISRLIGEFRRACLRHGDMTEAERVHGHNVLVLIEKAALSEHSMDDPEDVEVLNLVAEFKDALRGPGLSDEQREGLASADGFLNSIEGFIREAMA